MQVQGVVISSEVDVQVAKKDGGSYSGARLTYRDSNGKVAEQAFHVNAFKFAPELKNTLKSLQAGDNIVIEKEKSGDYWKVLSITKTTGGNVGTDKPETTNKPISSPKSTYETPEERAKKQVYIVRQSSITNAIALKPKSTEAEIIKTAKVFEKYVFGGEFDDGSIMSIKGDESEVF